MKHRRLGKTGLQVSQISFGASALGGVFREVDEATAIEAVHTALELGINYFDVAPAYGGLRAEAVLGKALKGVPREDYILSTKVGKYTDPERYGHDEFDYSRDRIRRSVTDSMGRLGVDHLDIVHLHDFDYQGQAHADQALGEGLQALHELKAEGQIGAAGAGIYAMDLWKRTLTRGRCWM